MLLSKMNNIIEKTYLQGFIDKINELQKFIQILYESCQVWINSAMG